jgi:hypothetical protein
MLTKLDAQIAKALVGIEHNPDWQIIRKWLDGNRVILQDKMSTERDETSTRWIQGALQLLGALSSSQDQARDVLHKLKNGEPRAIAGSFNEPL